MASSPSLAEQIDAAYSVYVLCHGCDGLLFWAVDWHQQANIQAALYRAGREGDRVVWVGPGERLSVAICSCRAGKVA